MKCHPHVHFRLCSPYIITPCPPGLGSYSENGIISLCHLPITRHYTICVLRAPPLPWRGFAFIMPPSPGYCVSIPSQRPRPIDPRARFAYPQKWGGVFNSERPFDCTNIDFLSVSSYNIFVTFKLIPSFHVNGGGLQ